jgi:hypothetical protein
MCKEVEYDVYYKRRLLLKDMSKSYIEIVKEIYKNDVAILKIYK